MYVERLEGRLVWCEGIQEEQKCFVSYQLELEIFLSQAQLVSQCIPVCFVYN